MTIVLERISRIRGLFFPFSKELQKKWERFLLLSKHVLSSRSSSPRFLSSRFASWYSVSTFIGHESESQIKDCLRWTIINACFSEDAFISQVWSTEQQRKLKEHPFLIQRHLLLELIYWRIFLWRCCSNDSVLISRRRREIEDHKKRPRDDVTWRQKTLIDMMSVTQGIL